MRPSDDFPPGASEIHPVWKNTSKEQHLGFQKLGFAWREDYTDADGFLKNPRLGFYWR